MCFSSCAVLCCCFFCASFPSALRLVGCRFVSRLSDGRSRYYMSSYKSTRKCSIAQKIDRKNEQTVRSAAPHQSRQCRDRESKRQKVWKSFSMLSSSVVSPNKISHSFRMRIASDGRKTQPRTVRKHLRFYCSGCCGRYMRLTRFVAQPPANLVHTKINYFIVIYLS